MLTGLSFGRRTLIGILLVSSWFMVQSVSGSESALTTNGGDRFRGQCLNVQKGILLWQSAFKDTIRIPLAEVSEANSGGNIWDLSFKDGQVLRGAWSISQGKLEVRSDLFGTVQCPVIELAAAERAVSAKGLEEPAAPSVSVPEKSAEPAVASTPSKNESPTSSLETLLRQSSILLRPGQWSVSSGFSYAHSRALYSQYDTRQFSFEGLVQHGITPRIEASLQWRSTLSGQTKYTNDPSAPLGSSSTLTTLRAGNPEFSVGTLLFSEGRIRPECLAIAGLTIPVNQSVHGGIFGERVGLEFLKTSDPGALFAGIGWVHEQGGWSRSPFEPVEHVLYHFGAAVGLNDELALGFQLQGEFRSELRDRSHAFLAGSQEPVAGRFWANFRAARNCFIETSAALPMNDDNHSTTLSVTYIQRF